MPAKQVVLGKAKRRGTTLIYVGHHKSLAIRWATQDIEAIQAALRRGLIGGLCCRCLKMLLMQAHEQSGCLSEEGGDHQGSGNGRREVQVPPAAIIREHL